MAGIFTAIMLIKGLTEYFGAGGIGGLIGFFVIWIVLIGWLK